MNLVITPEQAKNFNSEDRGFYSDMFKEENGTRPTFSNNELIDWINFYYILVDNRIIKKSVESINTELSNFAHTFADICDLMTVRDNLNKL
jgi:hypothetical protein